MQLQYLRSAAGAADELHVRFNRLHLEWNPATITALLAFFRDARDDELVGRLRVVNFASVYHSRDLAFFDRPRARASRRVR